MSAPMHTPGPWGWDYNRGGLSIFSGDDLVAEINADCPIAKADARLIAAAPELLQAAMAGWALLQSDERYADSECKDMLAAAIAKATGAA